MAVRFAARDQEIPLATLERGDIYASRYPDISAEKWPEFIIDLGKGQQDPIAVFKTKDGHLVVDGYQRWRALKELGKTTVQADILAGSWAKLDEAEQLAFCDSRNKHRRHLTFSQKVKKYKDKTKSSGGRPKTRQKPSKKTNDILSPVSEDNVSDSVSADDAAKAAGYSSTRFAQRDQALFDATIPDVHKAIDDKKITKAQAKEIAQVDKAEQLAALARALADEPIKEPDKPKEEEIKDCLGGVVPSNLKDIFSSVPDWKSAMQLISQAKGAVNKIVEHVSSKWLDGQEAERLLSQARALLKFAIPYTECVKCRRKIDKACVHCRGKGWLTRSNFTACASDQDKAWLEKRTA